jgi:hypothetical protein
MDSRTLAGLADGTQNPENASMDGNSARLTGNAPVETVALETDTAASSPALRLAGTVAYENIDPSDERLGALRNACCLLERLRAEAAALDDRSAQGRGDPMTVASGRSGLGRAVEQLEALIRRLDEAVLKEIESSEALAP